MDLQKRQILMNVLFNSQIFIYHIFFCNQITNKKEVNNFDKC